MGNGPITIFDKSMLQSLSLDEAVLFGQFYWCVLTPLFFVETLADLEKKVREGQTPEQVVGVIAAKTGNMSLDPSAHHEQLVIADLLGDHVSMDGRIHMGGGRFVKQDGKQGVVFEQSREVRAFNRWQKRQFLEIEREIAKEWREGLKEKPWKLPVKQLFHNARPKDLAEAKHWADTAVRRKGGPAFVFALDTLGIPSYYRHRIFARWLNHGAPPISTFAPYAAHVLTVSMFFRLAVSFDLISGDRPSNGADIAYLHYLPFCMMFTSNDKLHAKTVPLFLRPNQQFVPGNDLKTDLKRLDEYFSAQPQEVRDRGVMHFEPPDDESYLTARLWKAFLPGWRPGRGPKDVQMSSNREKELVAELKGLIEAPTSPRDPSNDPNDSDFIALQRMVPVKIGKWRILAEDVAESAQAAQAQKKAERAAASARAELPTVQGKDRL